MTASSSEAGWHASRQAGRFLGRNLHRFWRDEWSQKLPLLTHLCYPPSISCLLKPQAQAHQRASSEIVWRLGVNFSFGIHSHKRLSPFLSPSLSLSVFISVSLSCVNLGISLPLPLLSLTIVGVSFESTCLDLDSVSVLVPVCQLCFLQLALKHCPPVLLLVFGLSTTYLIDSRAGSDELQKGNICKIEWSKFAESSRYEIS